MQPMLHYLFAHKILMDRFATKATNVPPKVINLIVIDNASAQATNPPKRQSAHGTNIVMESGKVCIRVVSYETDQQHNVFRMSMLGVTP